MAGAESVDGYVEGAAVQVIRLPVFGQVIGGEAPFYTAVGRCTRVGSGEGSLSLGDIGGVSRRHGRRDGRRASSTATGRFAVQFEERDVLLRAGVAAELLGTGIELQEAGGVLDIIGAGDPVGCHEGPAVIVRGLVRTDVQAVGTGIQAIVVVAHLHGIARTGLVDTDVVGLA